jgi:predicted nucleic acid-binding protein
VAKHRGRPTKARSASAYRPPPRTAAFDIRFVETSALLAALLEHDASALGALRAEGRQVTSALTFAEAARAVVRARAGGRLNSVQERAAIKALQVVERRCYVVAITAPILARVGRPYPVEPIRTLDAVHLATAEELGEPPQLVTIVTRDARVSANARALGYAVG